MNIKRIEWMKFVWPVQQGGIGVDRETGLPSSDPEPKMTDEEAVELAIKFLDDPGQRVFPNAQAMRVYEEVWKLLNDSKGVDS